MCNLYISDSEMGDELGDERVKVKSEVSPPESPELLKGTGTATGVGQVFMLLCNFFNVFLQIIAGNN
jgi:hypothetical protein